MEIVSLSVGYEVLTAMNMKSTLFRVEHYIVQGEPDGSEGGLLNKFP
jgi:hypothetical protein